MSTVRPAKEIRISDVLLKFLCYHNGCLHSRPSVCRKQSERDGKIEPLYDVDLRELIVIGVCPAVLRRPDAQEVINPLDGLDCELLNMN